MVAGRGWRGREGMSRWRQRNLRGSRTQKEVQSDVIRLLLDQMLEERKSKEAAMEAALERETKREEDSEAERRLWEREREMWRRSAKREREFGEHLIDRVRQNSFLGPFGRSLLGVCVLDSFFAFCFLPFAPCFLGRCWCPG